MKNKIQKITALFALLTILFGQVLTTPVYAEPSAPEAPSAPSAPSTPSAPEAPTTPSAPSTPEAPEPTPASTPKPEKTPKPENSSNPVQSPLPSSTPTPTSSPNASASPAPTNNAQNSGDQNQSSGTGNNAVNTGNANSGAVVAASANNNIATGATTIGEGNSAGVINSGNGANSNNNGSVSVLNNNENNQSNSAQVINNVDNKAQTGGNTVSKNTGGDASINTGDANVTGTIITNLNTNVAGVSVAEFNVEDIHRGDLVLDFAQGCVSNCSTGQILAQNTNNGADSNNNGTVNQTTNNSTFQSNEADVANNMILNADSGHNESSKNTNGDSNITTGDANVAANVLTFANNNIAGNVVYTVVNIFGDLIGDIIMPKDYANSVTACSTCGSNELTAANTKNGANSNNSSSIDQTLNNNTFQSNDANIENNLIIDANTASNTADKNTGGDSSIATGDTTVKAQVVNVANSNISGNWYLVIVNEAGKWIGKLIGSADGATMAGSAGTEFIVNDAGEIIAVNNANGADSNNNSTVNQTTNNTTTQTNNANIVNNVNLSGNTGKNNTSKNTGGNSSIKTGDVNIVANMVNFVNNNITGGGKLYVTVVNVFGSWLGDFVGPDQVKDDKPDLAITNQNAGGVLDEETSTQNNSNSTSNKTTKKKVVATTQSTNQSTSQPQNLTTGITSFAGSAIMGTAEVAGIKIAGNNFPDDAIAKVEVAKKKITINLAWLLLIIPLAGLLFLSRFKIALFSQLIKNKLIKVENPGVILGSIIAVSLFIIDKYQP